jgi:predicted nucleic acid-binding protein
MSAARPGPFCELAEALRVREVLAFDGDFSAAGFTELQPAPAD